MEKSYIWMTMVLRDATSLEKTPKTKHPDLGQMMSAAAPFTFCSAFWF